jgi:MFS family permease
VPGPAVVAVGHFDQHTRFDEPAEPGRQDVIRDPQLALAQLMVVLDATIVNIALPSAQRALGFSVADRQWVVTAYALAFGSLLLLGGRLADRSAAGPWPCSARCPAAALRSACCSAGC